MSSNRRTINISLIAISSILGVWVAGIYRQSSAVSVSPAKTKTQTEQMRDVISPNIDTAIKEDTRTAKTIPDGGNEKGTYSNTAYKSPTAYPTSYPTSGDTQFKDADIRTLSKGNPFSAEARKLLAGNLEENDSASRHRILSYCEHFRTSFTTRDIDFIRQVFSDNALIIVGHTVKTGGVDAASAGNRKVSYAVRSKKVYLENLEKQFAANKRIEVKFSGFKIMRHPTMDGIYGVTLRQEYSNDSYSDDGFLFLLWDFRDTSMPLIHVRTWQPAHSVSDGKSDVIDISDFNLE